MDKKIKTLAICGSPHKGNTFEVLQMMQKNKPEVDFKILMLSELNLKNCLGCYSCINNGEHSCPLDDDRDMIIEEMKEADAIIFASPTFARTISSLMKKFVERTSFFAHRPIFFGKHAMALATCAGFGADLTTNYLKENFTQCGFKFVPSVELMVARKSEKENSHNQALANAGYEKLIEAIKKNPKPEPDINQLVYFNIFKSISEMNKLKGWADFEFYRGKENFYYDVKIPFWKNKLAKWIAGKEVKKMKANK